jgi:hypothetical protein
VTDQGPAARYFHLAAGRDIDGKNHFQGFSQTFTEGNAHAS